MSKSVAALSLWLAPIPLCAQWLNFPTPGISRTADGKPNLSAPAPRTANGKPDLSGLWMLSTIEGGISQLKPSEIKPWAEKLKKERNEALLRDSPQTRCLPNGVGQVGLTKIVQTPALILMLRENLSYRQIFLDGRELPKDPNPAWMGYSVGRWEGDTLVVESAGYNERTWLDQGYPHTESLRITERFHRSDFGHLTVDTTYSDPEVYSKAWAAKAQMQYLADTDLLEYVCAENEKDSVHLVGKQSDDEKNAVKLAPEVLSRYVGTYVRQSRVGAREITVTLEGEQLMMIFLTASKAPMIPLSETYFSAFGTHFEFGKDDKGEVAYLIIRAVEGDVRADRKK